MKEKTMKVPVIDDNTHFIIDYEEITEDEERFLMAYKFAKEDIKKLLRELLKIK